MSDHIRFTFERGYGGGVPYSKWLANDETGCFEVSSLNLAIDGETFSLTPSSARVTVDDDYSCLTDHKLYIHSSVVAGNPNNIAGYQSISSYQDGGNDIRYETIAFTKTDAATYGHSDYLILTESEYNSLSSSVREEYSVFYVQDQAAITNSSFSSPWGIKFVPYTSDPDSFCTYNYVNSNYWDRVGGSNAVYMNKTSLGNEQETITLNLTFTYRGQITRLKTSGGTTTSSKQYWSYGFCWGKVTITFGDTIAVSFEKYDRPVLSNHVPASDHIHTCSFETTYSDGYSSSDPYSLTADSFLYVKNVPGPQDAGYRYMVFASDEIVRDSYIHTISWNHNYTYSFGDFVMRYDRSTTTNRYYKCINETSHVDADSKFNSDGAWQEVNVTTIYNTCDDFSVFVKNGNLAIYETAAVSDPDPEPDPADPSQAVGTSYQIWVTRLASGTDNLAIGGVFSMEYFANFYCVRLYEVSSGQNRSLVNDVTWYIGSEAISQSALLLDEAGNYGTISAYVGGVPVDHIAFEITPKLLTPTLQAGSTFAKFYDGNDNVVLTSTAISKAHYEDYGVCHDDVDDILIVPIGKYPSSAVGVYGNDPSDSSTYNPVVISFELYGDAAKNYTAGTINAAGQIYHIDTGNTPSAQGFSIKITKSSKWAGAGTGPAEIDANTASSGVAYSDTDAYYLTVVKDDVDLEQVSGNYETDWWYFVRFRDGGAATRPVFDTSSVSFQDVGYWTARVYVANYMNNTGVYAYVGTRDININPSVSWVAISYKD